MASPKPLLPLVVVCNNLVGTIRPVMDVLLHLPEATTEWCPLTNRRTLTYLGRHAQVLAGSTEETATWNHERVFYPPIENEPGSRRIAGFPGPAEHVGYDIGGQSLWQRLLEANWAAYCQRLPRQPRHRFYVEPALPWLPTLLHFAAMPHRTLFVVRDPRSELAEQWMAGRRRGALPAVVNCIETPLSFAERQCNRHVRADLAERAGLEQSAAALCVRYEDFLGATTQVWERLREWLALPHRPPPRSPATNHEWPEPRWRPILPESVLALYRKKMRAELEALGYAS